MEPVPPELHGVHVAPAVAENVPAGHGMHAKGSEVLRKYPGAHCALHWVAPAGLTAVGPGDIAQGVGVVPEESHAYIVFPRAAYLNHCRGCTPSSQPHFRNDLWQENDTTGRAGGHVAANVIREMRGERITTCWAGQAVVVAVVVLEGTGWAADTRCVTRCIHDGEPNGARGLARGSPRGAD